MSLTGRGRPLPRVCVLNSTRVLLPLFSQGSSQAPLPSVAQPDGALPNAEPCDLPQHVLWGPSGRAQVTAQQAPLQTMAVPTPVAPVPLRLFLQTPRDAGGSCCGTCPARGPCFLSVRPLRPREYQAAEGAATLPRGADRS